MTANTTHTTLTKFVDSINEMYMVDLVNGVSVVKDFNDQQIESLRAFNRTYTARLGLLNPRLDASPFTLSEARILYEVANRDSTIAAEIGRTLELDRAQVSRTLKRFSDRGLVETRAHPVDARNQLIALTPEGKAAFRHLENSTRKAVGKLLESFAPSRRARFLEAASDINTILNAGDAPQLFLRQPEAGDLSYVLYRQSALYAKEYGFNAEYEALIIKIIAKFQETFDPHSEAAWVAELDGKVVGSIFLVKGEASGIAKLRLLYVEPNARGSGIASKLVDTCIKRAREIGYTRLDLWTNSILADARRIYERAGFKLVKEEAHHSFGRDLIGQTWSLDLA